MRAAESYKKTTVILEGLGKGGLKTTIREKRLPPKLGILGKGGIWIWILLLGADVVYELAAFADGPDGKLTISQIIKRARGTGIVGSVVLFTVLALVYFTLNLHLVSEVF